MTPRRHNPGPVAAPPPEPQTEAQRSIRSRRSTPARRSGGRPRLFLPPHCPNRDCAFYHPDPSWKYVRDGQEWNASEGRRIQRFRCRHCQRRFSTRTFQTTYWLHRPDLFPRIASLSIAGAGLRQIARELGTSHPTVARHLARAGRHCLLFHRQILEGKVITEPIAFDGFETFEYSQFFPCHLNLAAGHQSWFLYHFTDSPLRRKGTMTPAQKIRRAELEATLGRPDPKAVEEGILELLRTVGRQMPWGRAEDPGEKGAGPGPGAAEARLARRSRFDAWFHSDDHPAYGRSFSRLHREYPHLRLHRLVTPSTDPRSRANPLFPVNLADLLLRHHGANHRRETIAFSKRRQAMIERLALFTVWRNYIKSRREKKPGETAAMRAGILDRRLHWDDLFRERYFPRRHLLPGVWWKYYWRRVRTLALGDRQTTHDRRFAF